MYRISARREKNCIDICAYVPRIDSNQGFYFRINLHICLIMQSKDVHSIELIVNSVSVPPLHVAAQCIHMDNANCMSRPARRGTAI